MAAIILAGGKSQRMGNCDKAFLKIGKEPIIKRQLRLLKKHFKKIIIVTNSADKYNGLKGVRIISDIVPHQGPLAGIMSGLMSSGERYNFVVACDMPFINHCLIKYMYRNSSGYDAVIPKINNRYEPLFGIYSKSCIEHIKALLEGRVFQISKLFPKVKVREIFREEISRFGLPEKIFMNVNTPDDLSRLRG